MHYHVKQNNILIIQTSYFASKRNKHRHNLYSNIYNLKEYLIEDKEASSIRVVLTIFRKLIAFSN